MESEKERELRQVISGQVRAKTRQDREERRRRFKSYCSVAYNTKKNFRERERQKRSKGSVDFSRQLCRKKFEEQRAEFDTFVVLLVLCINEDKSSIRRKKRRRREI